MKQQLLLTFIALSLAACQTFQPARTNPNGRTGTTGTANQTPPPELTDIWALRQLNGKVIDKAQFPRRVPYIDINLRDSHILGSTGCNRFSGVFQVTGNTLKIGSVMSTKVACANGMSVETEFLNALQAADAYKIEGKNLILMLGAAELMTLGRGD